MEARVRFKQLAIYWTGWGFIVLGVLGIFLPILQGILFLLIGLTLLSNSSPRAARLLKRLRERFPRLTRKYDAAALAAKDIQTRISARFDTAKTHARRFHRRIFRKRGKQTEQL
jgi:uncharacterized membrane protein YbaN (DUF454 family)